MYAHISNIYLLQLQTNVGAELFGDIIQVTIALPDSIRHSISWYLTFQPPYTRPYTHPGKGKIMRNILTVSLHSLDLFWNFTGSPYNTIFKILFISSSAYTLYLMLNDYKPTNDPNIDTFKVVYLLGASAVLGVLFPYKYTASEVRVLQRGRLRVQSLTRSIPRV